MVFEWYKDTLRRFKSSFSSFGPRNIERKSWVTVLGDPTFSPLRSPGTPTARSAAGHGALLRPLQSDGSAEALRVAPWTGAGERGDFPGRSEGRKARGAVGGLVVELVTIMWFWVKKDSKSKAPTDFRVWIRNLVLFAPNFFEGTPFLTPSAMCKTRRLC